MSVNTSHSLLHDVPEVFASALGSEVLPFLFRTEYNMSSLADELWIQEIQEKNEKLNEGLLE